MNIIYNLRINNNLIKFLMPNCYLIPISAIFIFFYIFNLVYKINGAVVSNVKPIFNINITIPTILLFRTSEILELYISLFSLVYFLYIYFKIKKNY